MSTRGFVYVDFDEGGAGRLAPRVATDIEVRIQQHAWAALSGRVLASAVDRVDEFARWDVRPVSARYVVGNGGAYAWSGLT